MKPRLLTLPVLRSMVSVFAAALLLPCLSVAQAPPHLLLGPDDFTRLNELAKTQPWAAKQRDRIIRQAENFPQSYIKAYGLTSLQLPPEGGAWMHLYRCPDTGSKLVFHPPNKNICPDTGKNYTGYPYDQVVYQMRADALDEGALDAALAFRLTGNHEDAEKAARILKLYADKYLSYPLHDKDGKQSSAAGRVYAQTLDEAIFIINIAWTYDLIQDTDVLTAADRRHIEKDLLYATVDTMSRGENAPTENIRSWITGGLAAVGFTLNDKALINRAISGPQGFHFQMTNWVKDGFWTEGALGYQFYALRPLEYLVQMATRAGINLWKEPNMEALFASPLGIMLPDGSLPPFNDANVNHLYEHADIYELPYTALRNPIFAAIIQHEGRNNRDAFLFGVPSVDGTALPKPKSEVFANAGYATLRAPKGDLTEIVKFGPTGEIHGHYDKLTEVIFARGGFLSVDPGTQAYGMPSHYTWDRMSMAHNTLSVDETSQKPATGRLVLWKAEPEFTAVTANAGPVYPNADLERTSLLTSEYVLEISTARSTDGKEHDFEWSYHNYGTQHADADFKPYNGFPQRDGYQHLSDNRVANISSDFHTRFNIDNNRNMNVTVLRNSGPSEVFTGLGLGPDLRVKVPYVIVRRRGTSARFVALHQPASATDEPLNVSEADGKIRIRSAKWEDEVTVAGDITYHRTPRP